jgi:hypothetical protein
MHLEGVEDPTGWIGATAWLIRAEVAGQADVRKETRHLELMIQEILYTSPTYFWLESYPTPPLAPGATVQADVTLPSTRTELRGRQVFVALQAAGDPVDLEEGTRAVDGERSYSAILIFDTNWRLIEAGGQHYDAFTEVIDLYGQQGPDHVIALINDAAGRLQSENQRFLAERDRSTEELASAASTPLGPTRGPLGEWRRSKGFEGSQEPTPDLEEWLATPAESRQLFVLEEEVLKDSDSRLDIGAWVQREVIIRSVQDISGAYPWLGLRFPGVGVLGPFASKAEKGLVSLYGFAPVSRDAELVGWTSRSFPALDSAVLIARLPSTMWSTSDEVTVDVVLNDAGHIEVETADLDAIAEISR